MKKNGGVDRQAPPALCPRGVLLSTIENCEKRASLQGRQPGVPGSLGRSGGFQKFSVIFPYVTYVPFLLPQKAEGVACDSSNQTFIDNGNAGKPCAEFMGRGFPRKKSTHHHRGTPPLLVCRLTRRSQSKESYGVFRFLGNIALEGSEYG